MDVLIELITLTDEQINSILNREAAICIGDILIRNWSFQSELTDYMMFLPYHSMLLNGSNFKTMNDLSETLKQAVALYTKLYNQFTKKYFPLDRCQRVINRIESQQGFKLNLNRLHSANQKEISRFAYDLAYVMIEFSRNIYEWLHVATDVHCMRIDTVCRVYQYFETTPSVKNKISHQDIDHDKEYLHRLCADKNSEIKPSALAILDSLVEHYYSTKEKYNALTGQYIAESAK